MGRCSGCSETRGGIPSRRARDLRRQQTKDDADTRSAKSARSHPEPPNKRSGERSVVYLADAARRTLRLQDGERAAGLDRPLDAKTRPFPKFDRDICTFGVDNPFSSMSNVDFAWRARAAETPFLLGANRHHDMLVQQLDETRIRFGRSVESASGSYKAIAHRYVHCQHP